LRFDEILIAIPAASDEQLRRILIYARACAVPVKTVPALSDLVDGRARIGNLSVIEPGDLLDRPPVLLDTPALSAQLTGRPVLVTGAAGSIGSELCRQLVAFDPAPLIMFDRAESALYLLQLELQRVRPSVSLEPIIGDITDEAHIAEVMDAFRPSIVYHAAAYKHVPLMEAAPIEAVRNNVLGTRAVVRAVERSGVSTFVVISTDKAVRPKSVMGMTKRIAEEIALSSTAATPVVVRFGNVLGSDGSVFPIFQGQLDRGGPVTVTDPAATRYFMSIPDAARLVLQASVMSRGRNVYLLDMGDPVRISDLARDMIHLSGFRPEDDVEIETIGLRPGEKVHEELVTGSESLRATAVRGIFAVEGTGTTDSALLTDEIRSLEEAVKRRDAGEVAVRLKAMVADSHLPS
jgi:FlaA1/EpsC-like NDP-sugar epimerase